MSIEIWPPIAPEQIQKELDITQQRELEWLFHELQETLKSMKTGLQECYALLAPIDPGSTLVLSTPRHEIVKGHITRVGTRIVKGTIHLRLRTLPHRTLTIDPEKAIDLVPLTSLHALLTQSINMLTLTLSYLYPPDEETPSEPRSPTSRGPPVASSSFLAAQLRFLWQSILEASSLLRGPSLPTGDPTWTACSTPLSHFIPLTAFDASYSAAALSSPSSTVPPLSFYLSVQESSLVLWLRTLEPVDAPVHFGTKLALAIGTTRRLEHDEAGRVFSFSVSRQHDDDRHGDDDDGPNAHTSISQAPKAPTTTPTPQPNRPNPPTYPTSGTHPENRSFQPPKKPNEQKHDVFVREKVRIKSADPSLLALSAKLSALSVVLALARRNLAAVMGEDVAGDD